MFLSTMPRAHLGQCKFLVPIQGRHKSAIKHFHTTLIGTCAGLPTPQKDPDHGKLHWSSSASAVVWGAEKGGTEASESCFKREEWRQWVRLWMGSRRSRIQGWESSLSSVPNPILGQPVTVRVKICAIESMTQIWVDPLATLLCYPR